VSEGSTESALVAWLVTHGQLITTLTAAGCQHFASVLICHALTEAMLVAALALVWLKRPFHRLNSILSREGDAKVTKRLWITNAQRYFSEKICAFSFLSALEKMPESAKILALRGRIKPKFGL